MTEIASNGDDAALTHLYNAADNLIAEHGEGAVDFALDRANNAIRHSDMFGSKMWKQLRDAIEHRLQTRD